jgi:hypothetical protein
MGSASYTNFLAMLSSVANEVLEENGSTQRFNTQGKPLRRTEAVDPEYHEKLRTTSQKVSDKRSRHRVNSMFAVS